MAQKRYTPAARLSKRRNVFIALHPIAELDEPDQGGETPHAQKDHCYE
jgi:hypothetical protein